MTTRVLEVAELSDADERRWRDLTVRAASPNVWLDPRFVVPASRWPGMVDGMHLVVAADADAWTGVLAVEVHRPLRRLPLTISTGHGRFMSWHSDRRHPLVRDGSVETVLPHLLAEACALSSSRAVRLGEVPREPEWIAALERWDSEHGVVRRHGARTLMQTMPDTPRTTAPPDRAADVIAAASQLSARTRRRLASYMRRLERDTQSPPTIVRLDQDAEAVTQFAALQSRGWKGDPTRGGAGVSLDPHYARWFRDVADGFGADGDLAVHALEAGGRTIAMHVGLRAGATWIGFVDAYDERFAAYRPGNAVRVGAATLLTWDGAHVYDSGVASGSGGSAHEYGAGTPVMDIDAARGVAGRASLGLLHRAMRWRDARDRRRGADRPWADQPPAASLGQ